MKDNPGGRIQAITVTRIIGIIWLVEAAVAAGYNTAIVEKMSRVVKLDVTLLHSSEGIRYRKKNIITTILVVVNERP